VSLSEPIARRIEVGIALVVLAALLLYWLAWAVIGPVTNVDAQIYNLTRLWVIDGHGLFANPFYTSTLQLVMPWSFDAVHYPFLLLRHGYALPSFACLLGIMAILYSWARERGGVADGLRACLGLLAMPMVVMQATTTKNDLVLALCLVCWIEAMRRSVSARSRASVLLAALALTFAAGSKVTGLLYAGIAAVASLWILRRTPVDLAWFVSGLAGLGILNGSLEVFVNNRVMFGDWRGDPLWYQLGRNNDGWRGWLANEIRYVTSLLDLQILSTDSLHRFALWKFSVCQTLLRVVHLQGFGFMSAPWNPMSEDHLRRLMTTLLGSDTRATYGILGALLTTAMPILLALRRRLDFPAALFLAGVASQVVVAATIGWHTGNLRYLVVPACLSWAAASLLVISDRHPWLPRAATLTLAACALFVPFSVSRSPENLAIAFRDRDALLPEVERRLMDRADAWRRNGDLPVVVTATRARTFYLYDRLGPQLIGIPDLSEDDLVKLDAVYRRGAYRIVAIKTKIDVPGVVCEAPALDDETQVCLWRRR